MPGFLCVKKKKKVFRNSSVVKSQVKIVYHHQQTELIAFVMINVKFNRSVGEEKLLSLGLLVCIVG